MRTSRKRRGGHPPHSGHMKPPQKLLRPLPDSARLGFSHRHSYRAKSLEGPPRRVFFFRSSEFLQLLPQERPRIVPAQTESARIFFTRQVQCNFQAFFPKSYNYDQRIADNVVVRVVTVHAGRSHHLSRGHMIGLLEPLQKLSQCPDRFFSFMFSQFRKPVIWNRRPCVMLPVQP